jgi:hypothetical protein
MAGAGFSLGYQNNPGIQFAQQSDPNAPGAYNPWSFPGAPPTYTGAYNPNTMGVDSDPTALNMFRTQAERTGPSAYANLANTQQDTLSQQARSSAANQNQGNQATAESALAMRGGIDSGARERIATQGNKNLLDMNQKINQTSANNKMQIGMNDEQNRISQLSQVPGMQNTQNQAAEFNIGNAINEGNAANAYKYGIYNTQMKGYAAGQQANATANSGGSWLCTEALKDFGRDEWKYLLKLRRYAARKDMEVTAFYIYDCNTLVDRMKESGANWESNKRFVSRIIDLVKRGKLEQAYKLYFRVVRSLCLKYWPDCDHPVFTAYAN